MSSKREVRGPQLAPVYDVCDADALSGGDLGFKPMETVQRYSLPAVLRGPEFPMGG